MRKEKKIWKGKWYTFYFGKAFDISYEVCGYFDNRPRINLDLFFFNLTLILPFKNDWTDECDPPKWGIAWHNQTFWIYRGGKGNMNGGNKWWTVYAPWSYQWVRTSTLLKDQTWFNETIGNRVKWNGDSNLPGSYEWLNANRYQEVHKYIYNLKSGDIQNVDATIKIEEREWRWHWLKWLPFLKKIDKSISIDFSSEVGERAGSWKGGCTGCGYTMLKDETPLECLRRMEKERKF